MRAIGKFLALTFGATWALWALVMWTIAHHTPTSVPPALGLGGAAFLIGVFAPGLIAVALTAMDDGVQGVRALLGRILQWRVGWQFYAFALLLMPLTKIAVAILDRALTGAWPHFGDVRPVFLVAATILGTLGQAGEEVGWRGYLLPRLTERAGLVIASLAVGVIWAVWHLPLFFAQGADTNHQSFLWYASQIVAYSIALAWLYWRTGGSLLLTMFMHSAFNNMKDIVPSGAVGGGRVFSLDATLVLRLTVLVLWVVGALLLVRMRGVRSVGNVPRGISRI
ncbi:MAG: CPBP family intramembrane glutamic endopeptidase [Gemmatimonadaceae bacterium]